MEFNTSKQRKNMEALDHIEIRNGRPVLKGCRTLPKMVDDSEPKAAPKRETTETKKPAKQSADRFGTLNRFVDITMRDLTPSERLVWIVLFRDVRDGNVKVAQADVATRSGLTRSTVSLAIKRLIERGLVRVVRQGGFRKGMSSYQIRGSV